MVIAVAEMFGISGRRDELAELLARFERWAAGEPGCRRYTFAAALADPSRFVLLSEWDSKEALDTHYRSEEFADFQFGLDGLLARPSEMTVYSVGEGRVGQSTRARWTRATQTDAQVRKGRRVSPAGGGSGGPLAQGWIVRGRIDSHGAPPTAKPFWSTCTHT